MEHLGEKRRGFVCIPGAGMSDWSWSKLVPLLNKEVFTIPKRIAFNTQENRQSCKFQDILDYANEIIEKSGLEEIVLICHSGAGLIGGELGKSNPKVVRVVYLAANIPPDQHNALTAFPEEIKKKNKDALKAQAAFDFIPMNNLEMQFRQFFCNRTQEEDIQFILLQNFQPEPVCVITHTVDWSNYPAIPMTYVLCLQDKTVTIDMQRQFAKNLNITDIRQLDGDHMVMFSCTEELAELLNAF